MAAVTERGVLDALGHVVDPEKGADIVSLGMVSGLVIRDEMDTDCCYAKQNKTWVHDPDGNEWEVFVVLEDNLPEKSAGSACCVSTTSA